MKPPPFKLDPKRRPLWARLGFTRLAAVALFSVGCDSPQPPAPEVESVDKPVLRANATRVETQPVRRGAAVLRLRLPGEVESSRDALLASVSGGYVEKLLVQEGEAVRAGQSLAWINRAVADAQLQQAAAQLALAEHEMDVVRKAGRSLSRSRRVRAEVNLSVAQAAQRLAAVNAGYARLRAPFAGVVSEVNIEAGEVAAPGMPAIRLVQVNPLKVTVSISDRDIRWVKPGAKATVLADGGAVSHDATVSRVSAAADLDTRTFVAEVDLPNRDGSLAPGMMVSVVVEIAAGQEAVTVPQYALVTRAQGNGVFVAEDGIARWRSLRLGGLIGHDLVVIEGLREEDALITKGHRELADGDPLILVPAKPTVAAITPARQGNLKAMIQDSEEAL